MNLSLINKRAVVAGSTAGIGKATALELAELGASVTLIARNEDKLRDTAKELSTEQGQDHHILTADFSDPSLVEEKFRNYVKSLDSLHILINNSGGPPGGQAIDASLEQFRTAFNQHLICNQILTTLAVPLMKKEGYGRIINIISTSVKAPIPGLGVSNTIRGAVGNWSKTLANELGPFHITVNNILPGATKTDRLYSIIENKAAKEDKDVDEVRKKMEQEIPARRFAEVHEVAQAVAFLATPAASYVNGVNLAVDGGRLPCG